MVREVLEEPECAPARVSYFASQPWPFPSSLMSAATHGRPAITSATRRTRRRALVLPR